MKKITEASLTAALVAVDWAKIDDMTDEDIERQIAENPDAAPDLTVKGAKLLFLIGSPRLKTGVKVRLLRRAFGMSQSQFAKAYHVPLRSLQNWEQGSREPDAAVGALIKLIAHDPKRTKRILGA